MRRFSPQTVRIRAQPGETITFGNGLEHDLVEEPCNVTRRFFERAAAQGSQHDRTANVTGPKGVAGFGGLMLKNDVGLPHPTER